jgi:hypothetical protein
MVFFTKKFSFEIVLGTSQLWRFIYDQNDLKIVNFFKQIYFFKAMKRILT